MKQTKRKDTNHPILASLKHEIRQARKVDSLEKLKQEVDRLTVADFDSSAEQLKVSWIRLFQKSVILILHQLNMMVEFDGCDKVAARDIGHGLTNLLSDMNRLREAGRIYDARIKMWSVNLLQTCFTRVEPSGK